MLNQAEIQHCCFAIIMHRNIVGVVGCLGVVGVGRLVQALHDIGLGDGRARGSCVDKVIGEKAVEDGFVIASGGIEKLVQQLFKLVASGCFLSSSNGRSCHERQQQPYEQSHSSHQFPSREKRGASRAPCKWTLRAKILRCAQDDRSGLRRPVKRDHFLPSSTSTYSASITPSSFFWPSP